VLNRKSEEALLQEDGKVDAVEVGAQGWIRRPSPGRRRRGNEPRPERHPPSEECGLAPTIAAGFLSDR
jgi:hypothetical protein